MQAGTRVLVDWTDGRRYSATVLGFQNGYFRVQWDGAQTTAWVPVQAARPMPAGPPPPSAPAAAPPPAPWELGLPTPAGGAQNVGATASPSRAAAPGAQVLAAPAPRAATPVGSVAPMPVGPVPPMTGGPVAIAPAAPGVPAFAPPAPAALSGAAARPAHFSAPVAPAPVAPAPVAPTPPAASAMPARPVHVSAPVTPAPVAPAPVTPAPVAPAPPAPSTPASPLPSSFAPPPASPAPAAPLPGASAPAPAASVLALSPAASTLGAPAAASAPAVAGAPKPSRLAGVDGLPRGLVFEPTGSGPGAGKAFYFFFALSPLSRADAKIMRIELDQIGDDVAALRAGGYRVVVDLLADLPALVMCLKNEHPDAGGARTAGVFWTSHGGPDGRIEDWRGRRIGPADLGEGLACPELAMFVLSACYVANHADKWQKALGGGAKVFGWGAPITAERAADFLRQDETTAKGFDDLLALHLGAARVAKEGPLAEAVELGEALAKRLFGHLPSYDELIEIVGTRAIVKPSKLEGAPDLWGFLVARFVADRPKPRTQGVRVALLGDWVYVTSTVGPYSELIDLTKAMQLVGGNTFTRVFLSKPPEGPPFLIVSSTSTLRGLSATALWGMISTVGDVSDELEDLYFGSDDR